MSPEAGGAPAAPPMRTVGLVAPPASVGRHGVRGHLAALTRLVPQVLLLAAVADDGALAARYGAEVVHDLDALLGRVDAVDAAVAGSAAPHLIEAALRAERPVIGAPPSPAGIAGAERLVALAGALGVPLLLAHPARRAPERALLQRAVASGELGRIAVARFTRAGPAQGGDLVRDGMIDDLDLAGAVCGEVVRVSAVARAAGGGPAATTAAHVLLEHAGGAISQCSGVWGPAHLTASTEYAVTGDAGDLAHSSRAERAVDARLAEFATPLRDEDDDRDLLLELRDLLDALQDPGATATDPSDGLAAWRVAEAAHASIASGQPVEVRGAGGTA